MARDDMSMKRVFLSTLILVLLGPSVGRAQAPSGLYGGPASPETSAASGTPEEADRQRPTTFVPSSALSPYLLGTQPDCCGPVTDGNPLQTEFYVRPAFSTLFGHGPLPHDLATACLIQRPG